MPGTTSTPVKTLFVEHILVLSQFLDAFNLLIVSEIFYDLDILGQVFTVHSSQQRESSLYRVQKKTRLFIVVVLQP